MATPSAAGAPSGASPYQSALDRLAPLQPVLHGLNHRNKNQHRRASWWRAFGLLRRNVDRLVDDLDAAVVKKRKRRQEGGPNGSKAAAEGGPTALDSRAAWTRDVLVGRCYLAFSQLIADSQFAPLGVVLLGALAQTRAACVCIVGAEADDASAPRSPSPPVTASLSAVASVSTAGATSTAELGAQGGRALSREEAEGLRHGTTATTDVPETSPAQSPVTQLKHDEGSKRKRRGVGGNRANSQISSQHGTPTGLASASKQTSDDEDASAVRKKKKKKKAKTPKTGGDEFDNLFKGLL
ncbi:hypothetical protein F5Y15DRAFT_397447 [Xylariaceae sp. FL0016]|nr:hypothetical protein F5Y15DRAFT_397447 [Xylariaceae sp. FL0016]